MNVFPDRPQLVGSYTLEWQSTETLQMNLIQGKNQHDLHAWTDIQVQSHTAVLL